MGEIKEKAGEFASEFFKNIHISPRLSFWISTAALIIVLFNNHVYIEFVKDREKEAARLLERNLAEAEDLSKRERILRNWEAALVQREQELGRSIRELKSVR